MKAPVIFWVLRLKSRLVINREVFNQAASLFAKVVGIANVRTASGLRQFDQATLAVRSVNVLNPIACLYLGGSHQALRGHRNRGDASRNAEASGASSVGGSNIIGAGLRGGRQHLPSRFGAAGHAQAGHIYHVESNV